MKLTDHFVSLAEFNDEYDSLSNKMMTTNHHNYQKFTDKQLTLLNNIVSSNMAFYCSFSAALALGRFLCVVLQNCTVKLEN